MNTKEKLTLWSEASSLINYEEKIVKSSDIEGYYKVTFVLKEACLDMLLDLVEDLRPGYKHSMYALSAVLVTNIYRDWDDTFADGCAPVASTERSQVGNAPDADRVFRDCPEDSKERRQDQ